MLAIFQPHFYNMRQYCVDIYIYNLVIQVQVTDIIDELFNITQFEYNRQSTDKFPFFHYEMISTNTYAFCEDNNKSSQVKQQNYMDHEIQSLNVCKYKYVCQQLSDKDIPGGCVHGQSASEAKPLVKF